MGDSEHYTLLPTRSTRFTFKDIEKSIDVIALPTTGRERIPLKERKSLGITSLIWTSQNPKETRVASLKIKEPAQNWSVPWVLAMKYRRQWKELLETGDDVMRVEYLGSDPENLLATTLHAQRMRIL
jgi:hypothetical protein